MSLQFIPVEKYRNEAIELLENNNLPTSDLDDKGKLLFALVQDQDLIGTGGIEIFQDQALIRSVSVRKDKQGQGLGKFIHRELEKIAVSKKVKHLFLLTTTARQFFEKEGYAVIDRERVPEVIRASSEFSELCPSTATVMKKDIQPKKKLLFVCVENSNRSQMSQAFAKMLGGEEIEAYSAGSKPSGVINPKAIAAMKELNYDLSGHASKSLDEVKRYAPFDVVVTMGCGDACPWMPAKKFVDWEIPDPRNMEPAEFNKVRDTIRDKVKDLLVSLKQPN